MKNDATDIRDPRGPLPASRPAVLGGIPLFPDGLPLARPRFASPASLTASLERIASSGVLTDGPTVRELEQRSAEYLGVRHCVAVASCTTGLMLLLRAADVSGDVIVPSFTFAATAHAVEWVGARPIFADIDPRRLTLSAAEADRAIGVRVSAILATHIYGTPADIEGLTHVASRSGVYLFFDAAHAFGSRHAETRIGGFGAAEVFSLTPTKTLVAGEGGIIATNDDLLAERCRLGRNYGHPGDYDCRFVGLNARMSEFHAAVALASFEDLDARIERRNELASTLREALSDVPGVDLPDIAAGDRSTFKDLSILVDGTGFGLDADELSTALSAEGIETRRYYSPPVHRMRAYRQYAYEVELPATDEAARKALALPLLTDMSQTDMIAVAEAIIRIQRSAAATRVVLEGTPQHPLTDRGHAEQRSR
jgi:dTDP-4-amino-4,6-dideoxygalactose transaminase